MAERNKPQWQAIAVALSFCTIVGGLVYWPIQSATGDLKTAVGIIADKMVTQKDLEYRQQRGTEDRARTDQSIADIRESLVPRSELERVWHSNDLTTAQLQKEIDELKQAQSSTYNSQDVLLD